MDTMEISDLYITDVCRCCLSQLKNLKDLFIPTDTIDIAKAIEDVCGINICPDISLPDKICDDCLDCLKTSYVFRIKTLQSANTLQCLLEGNIIVKELVDKDETTPITNFDLTNCEPEYESGEETIINDQQDQAYTFDEFNNFSTKLQCSYCQKTFIHSKNLRTHIKRHFTEGKYTCPHCLNRYHTKFDLQRHMTKIHDDGVFFKCDLCDMEFPTKSEWNRHMRVHEDVKSFSCPECGMQFKLKQNARQHMMIVHEKRKAFFCEECGKGFAFACKLKNHQSAKCKPSIKISILKDYVTEENEIKS